MNSTHHPKLTSAEIAGLWTQYMNETAGLCLNVFILQWLEDEDIRAIYEYAIYLGKEHVQKIKEFLISDGFPIPRKIFKFFIRCLEKLLYEL